MPFGRVLLQRASGIRLDEPRQCCFGALPLFYPPGLGLTHWRVPSCRAGACLLPRPSGAHVETYARPPKDKAPGNDLLSHRVAPAVPSAREGLASLFGMGRGVSPPPWSPEANHTIAVRVRQTSALILLAGAKWLSPGGRHPGRLWRPRGSCPTGFPNPIRSLEGVKPSAD